MRQVTTRQGLRTPTLHSSTSPAARASRLDRPLSGWWCALGWLAATGVFFGLVLALGGANPTDSPESTFTTLAIGHGQLACAYPPGDASALPALISPLYPLLAGAVEAVTGIGHTYAFPSQSALGPGCSTAMQHALLYGSAAILRIGYIGWVALLAGLVALLRACGRGRCVWEPVTLLVVAALPSVLMTLTNAFHPQDMLAMGLALGGLACARRGSWIWAGCLLGLAVTSQQFALLVLVPLLVVVPHNRRIRFAGAAAVAAALVVVPLVVITSGRALKWVLLGSGTGVPGPSTLIAKFPIHGPIVLESRVLPLALSIVLAWWAVRRLGSAVLEPLPLISLVATSLSLRLVFEINMLGYYPMAMVVSLVTLSVVRGRFSPYMVAWLGFVALGYSPLPWGFSPLTYEIAPWVRQTLILSSGIVLAVGPLTSAALARVPSGIPAEARSCLRGDMRERRHEGTGSALYDPHDGLGLGLGDSRGRGSAGYGESSSSRR